jgi:3-isopropylmalate/(R)-2-methylmalate dehydratase small subunit
VDLQERTVTGPSVEATFEIDDFTRHRLLNGLDDISLTLTHEDELEAFEGSRPGYLPKVLQLLDSFRRTRTTDVRRL